MKCTSRKFTTALLIAAAGLVGRPAPAQVIWTAASGTDTNWSTAANWNNTGNPGAVPGAADQVKFFDGGNTNAAGVVNNVVDTSFTVASLQYANTNGFHTTLIAPGATLNVGTNLVGTTVNSGTLTITSAIQGTGGAALNVSGGNVGVSQGSNGKSILDLSGLDTFNANVVTIGIGAINYPATDSSDVGSLLLAKTNVLVVSGNTTSGSSSGVQAGFLIGDPRTSGPTSGSSIQLGQTNAIFANLIVVGARKGGSSLHTMTFNGAFANPVVVFRASDGASRVPAWSIGDDNFASGGSTASSGAADFTGGRVDALVSTLIVGRGQGGAGNRGTGTLTFNNGTINADTLQVGFQSGAAAGNGPGTGTVNVNGTATLTVNTALELGHVTTPGGTAAAGSIGTLNVNGGAVRANVITNQGIGAATINLSGGATLLVTNAIASPGIPLRNFGITNSTLTLPTLNGIPTAVTTNFNASGNNTVNISAVPVIASYPATLPLVKYTTSSGTFNFALGTLPPASPAFSGYITNSVATASLNLVLTNGPRTAQALTWAGQIANGNWDTATGNWRTNGIGGAVYNDPDFVTFDDTAVTNVVTLAGVFSPSALVVSNNTVNYTWNGFGSLSGSFNLDKKGSGSLIVDNFGNNTFNGGFTIESGVVQLGQVDGGGTLGAGPVLNNGALVDDRNDDHEIANAISGGGSLSKLTNGTLTLSGNNSFTGAVTVAGGTLRINHASALGSVNGSTTIADGATLDVYGKNLGSEQIIAAGIGMPQVGFTNGAIANSWTNQTQALRFVTLTGDTVIRTDARLDIRGTPASLLASPAASPFKITKLGLNQLTLASVTNVDAGLGDIDVVEGIFSVQSITAQLGNSASNLIVRGGATLSLNDLNAHPLNKVITLADNVTVQNEAGRSVITGPVTVQGLTTIAAGGTSLTFSNAIGGPGNFSIQTTNPVVFAGGVNTYGGATFIQSGKLVLNCLNSGGSGLTNNGTLAGNGTNAGPVECDGPLRPGDNGLAGSFGTGGAFIFNSGDLIFDLNTNNTTAAGINDFIDVAGNLTLTGNPISINPLHGALQAGTYRLIHYGGSLSGTFAGDPAAVGYYTFTLDYSEPHWIKLVVTAGTPSYLTWSSAVDSSWESSLTWSNRNTAAIVAFTQGDFVTFDDSLAGVQTNIVINSTVFPSGITNNSGTNNYVISGGRISGITGLYKTGTNILTLSGSNDFTGTTLVNQGILRLGAVAAANGALGDLTVPAIVTNTGTLDLNGFGGSPGTRNLQGKTILIAGPGASDTNGNPLGTINNLTGVRSDNAVQNVTLTGDATLGAAGAPFGFSWNIRSPTGDPADGKLSSGGQPFKLTIVGAAMLSLFNVAVDPALGDIEVKGGVLDLGDNTTGLGNSASNLILQAGAALAFRANGAGTTSLWNKVFLLHGDGVTPSLTNRGGNHTLIGPVQLFGNVVFHGGIGGVLTNQGNITGAGGLTKAGTPGVTLLGVNTYAGDTAVNAGTLSLAGSGVISNTAKITIANGATLDVSGRTDAKLTLFAGQTLQGVGTLAGELLANAGSTISPGSNSIGTLTVSGPATFAGTNFIEINKATTNDQVFAGGAISYGGRLVLANLGPAYAANDSFKIFNGAGYSGSFTLEPATPGAGLAWDTSLLTASGTLKVVASTPPPAPTIQRIIVSGGNVILSGTNNNGPGGTYHVLTSTNIAQPLTNWAVLTNGSFDGGGSFSSTNAANGNRQQYYILQIP